VVTFNFNSTGELQPHFDSAWMKQFTRNELVHRRLGIPLKSSYSKGENMILRTFFLLTLAVMPATYAQTPEMPQSPQKGCLIVKHKGTIGRRLIFTSLTGFPLALGDKYDLVDSLGYQGAKLSYQGKELEEIQKTGTRIVVLPAKLRPEDVKNARDSCLCEPRQQRSGGAMR
jgi:hypothetical protein